MLSQGELDVAHEQYRQALVELGEGRPVDRARLFAKLGDVERRLGQVQLALYHYTEALALDPLNLSALFWATEILCERREYDQVERLLQGRLAALTDLPARVEVLRALANLWLDEQRDLERGRKYLDQILSEQPDDQIALARLVEVLHALGDHEEAVRARWWLASLCAEDRSRHAQLLVETARAAHQYLGDNGYAIDLAEQALAADPRTYEALELVASLLVEREDWPRLAQTYRRMLDVRCDDWVELDLCEKLGVLYREKLDDPARAREVLERALGLDPSNERLRLALAEVCADLADRESALSHCRALIQEQPEAASGYHLAYQIFTRLGDLEGAWHAARVADYLGQAEPAEAELLQAHPHTGLPSVQSTLTDAEWDSNLLWQEHDPLLVRLLRLVQPVAVDHRLQALEQQNRLLVPDPTLEQDPNVSTTMLSRTMLWVARLLGVPVPRLFVYPSVPGEIGATPGREPITLASRSLGSGFELAELAFLWARHLGGLRREQQLLLYFPTVGELSELITAAFVASDFTPRRAEFFDPPVRALAEKIASSLGPDQLGDLARITSELGLAEAGQRMMRWARQVELVAARAGLLAAGDVAVASALTLRFPVGSQTTPDEQRRDLLVYSVSEEYFELRRRLGMGMVTR